MQKASAIDALIYVHCDEAQSLGPSTVEALLPLVTKSLGPSMESTKSLGPGTSLSRESTKFFVPSTREFTVRMHYSRSCIT